MNNKNTIYKTFSCADILCQYKLWHLWLILLKENKWLQKTLRCLSLIYYVSSSKPLSFERLSIPHLIFLAQCSAIDNSE